MTKRLWAIAITFVVGITLGFFIGVEYLRHQLMSNLKATAVDQPAPPSWAYGERKDQLRGTTTKGAVIAAEDGGGYLAVKYGDGGHVEISITTSSPGIMEIDNVRDVLFSYKFDDGPIVNSRGPSFPDRTTLVMNAPERALELLVKSKKFTIEVPMYGRDPKQMTFGVTGLDIKRIHNPENAAR